jgi:DNA polymerase-1
VKAFLIDGTSFCYRAHYALPEFTTSDGRPTNAIYGFILILNKILQEEKPDLLAVAFDLKAPTFRHKKYKDYKVHRPPMPEGLQQQIPAIKEVIKAYNIALFQMEGFEGEDIIATIVKQLEKKDDVDIYIVTGDKDMLQLVNKNVKVYNTHKEGLIYDEKKVKQKYQVEPKRVIDIMALMGDKSDNIPGVKGIGAKTAQRLIKKFKTVEDLLENIDEIKSKRIKNKIKNNIENIKLSKDLVKIHADVPIDFSFKQLKKEEPNNKKLFKMFKELEFRKLLKKYAPEDKWQADYNLITTSKQLKDIISKIKKKKLVAFDFETTSKDPHKAKPVGISLCLQDGKAAYLPLLDESESKKEGLKRKEAFDLLKEVLEDEKIEKIGQNIKYEMIILNNYDIDIKGKLFDAMIASYLINPSKLNHNLEDISLEYLGHKMIPFSDLITKNDKNKTIKDVNIEKLMWYACEDSDVAFRLKDILEKKLKENNLYKLFEEIEIPLVKVLAYMELNGVAVNKNKLKSLSKDLNKRLKKIEKRVFNLAEEEFNLNSTNQLRKILFDKLRLPVVKRTKTGPSTDVEVLQKLSSKHKLPRHILKYRELTKLKTGYVDSLPKLINDKTGKIHTSFNQTVTQTGRLSSSSPNLQNIPVKGKLSDLIREAFVPRCNDFSFLSADYSQIELRILAHLSKDKSLQEAFDEDLDVHAYTASLIFNKDINEISKQERETAKTVNFSITYGVSPYGLSKELDIDVEQAKQIIDSYFDRYPKVKQYIDKTIKEAEEKGYVSTLFGRRRYIPNIKTEDKRQANFAKRIAINMPIQGTASDLIKIAMKDIYDILCGGNYKSKMILQIHDELIFDTFDEEMNKLKSIVKKKMENASSLSVPIKVDIKEGKTWAQC